MEDETIQEIQKAHRELVEKLRQTDRVLRESAEPEILLKEKEEMLERLMMRADDAAKSKEAAVQAHEHEIQEYNEAILRLKKEMVRDRKAVGRRRDKDEAETDST